jgi:hypothetical protein
MERLTDAALAELARGLASMEGWKYDLAACSAVVELIERRARDITDSPNFTLGPLDQARLARALLVVMPVVRASERWAQSHQPWTSVEPKPLSPSEHPFRDERDLLQAIASMRREIGSRDQ